MQLSARKTQVLLVLVFSAGAFIAAPSHAYAAITLISGGAVNGNTINGGNVTLTFPVGVQQGDVVIVYGGHPHRASTNLGPSTAGYTSIAVNNAASPDWGVWYKVMGASPDANVVGQGTANSADGTAYGAFIFRGVDSSVFDQTQTTAGPTTSTNPNAPAIVTNTADAWVVALAGSQVNDTAVTVPSGYSNNNGNSGNDTNDLSTYAATLDAATTGSYDPPSWTGWSSGAWYTVTIALKPAGTSNDYGTPAGPASNTDTGPFRIMRLFEGFIIRILSNRIVINQAR